MPTTIVTGSGFTIELVNQLTANSIRLRYTNDPLAVSSSGTHDALNISNYTITGPIATSVSSVSPTFGDTQSVDIFLSNILITGTYTISISNVNSVDAVTITSNTSRSFLATGSTASSAINGGVVNDTGADIIRKNFSPAMTGNNWNALIEALGSGDDTNFDNVKLAYDQLAVSTASSSYLDLQASDHGVVRPKYLGISDEKFRKLAIKLSTRKVVFGGLLDILEIYYEIGRAHV